MEQWRYIILASNGGQVQTSSGTMAIAQVLNSAGQNGGELAAVLPTGSNVFQWVIKFPLQAPTQPFEQVIEKPAGRKTSKQRRRA
jgi:hypothetical protein